MAALRGFLFLAACMLACTPADAQSQIELSLPVACDTASPCMVQNYVDHDRGPGVRDYACRAATYDAHDGTDFRLGAADATAVDVIAAAPGKVKGVRDGVADIFVRDGGKEGVKGRECGNGLVIDHGGGWETQYCHMRHASLAVRPGDTVVRGQRLGRVGFSGLADFAHLHLTVRYKGAAVDPFLYPAPEDSCATDPATANGLWDAPAREALRYLDGQIIGAGFSPAALQIGDLERSAKPAAPTPESPRLLFFVRAMNMRANDRLRIHVTGPAAFAADATTEPLDRHKAIYLGYSGKALKAARWPAGDYVGVGEVLRDGAIISEMTASLTLAP
ncbi:MAG: M23 family metallopeptidase [Hyphomicrobium sp.]|jgi:hypothetical protein